MALVVPDGFIKLSQWVVGGRRAIGEVAFEGSKFDDFEVLSLANGMDKGYLKEWSKVRCFGNWLCFMVVF